MNARLARLVVLVTMGSWACQRDANRDFERRDSGVGCGFEVHHGWPSLPTGHALGFVPAVEFDSHGHIFTFKQLSTMGGAISERTSTNAGNSDVGCDGRQAPQQLGRRYFSNASWPKH